MPRLIISVGISKSHGSKNILHNPITFVSRKRKEWENVHLLLILIWMAKMFLFKDVIFFSTRCIICCFIFLVSSRYHYGVFLDVVEDQYDIWVPCRNCILDNVKNSEESCILVTAEDYNSPTILDIIRDTVIPVLLQTLIKGNYIKHQWCSCFIFLSIKLELMHFLHVSSYILPTYSY